MSHNGKDNEELKVIYISDGAGRREMRLLAKGRIVMILVFFLCLFPIVYLWANGNKKPESMLTHDDPSFSGLNYRIQDTIKK
jgi:hypothetical protein